LERFFKGNFLLTGSFFKNEFNKKIKFPPYEQRAK